MNIITHNIVVGILLLVGFAAGEFILSFSKRRPVKWNSLVDAAFFTLFAVVVVALI